MLKPSSISDRHKNQTHFEKDHPRHIPTLFAVKWLSKSKMVATTGLSFNICPYGNMNKILDTRNRLNPTCP
jgi:hypothetical protein